MSTWDKLNEVLQEYAIVEIKLTPRQAYVCQEALVNWADNVIAEAAPWQLLEMMTEWGWPWQKKSQEKPDPSQLRTSMTGNGQKVVKSLDPKEVEVVRSIIPNAKARSGYTGQIMALPPKEWERIRKEIEAKPEYYDKMLGNEVSAAGLTKKIGDQLQLTMGPTGKSKMVEPQWPDMSGIAFDPTAIQHGAEQFGQMPDAPKIDQPPMLGQTFKQKEPENPMDDFDIDFDEPSGPETFEPAPAAKPKSSRKRTSQAKAAPPPAAPMDRFAGLAPAGSPEAASQAKKIRTSKKYIDADKAAVGSGRGRIAVK